eukprot:Nk52_evm14s299 gene=Nk52_evmTU14s299
MAEANELNAEAVGKWLTEHPDFAQKWFAENGTEDMVRSWSENPRFKDTFEGLCVMSRNKSRSGVGAAGKGASTLELNSIIEQSGTPMNGNSRQISIEGLDYKDVLLDLAKDIGSELDLRSLLYKILNNVCLLLKADRCSLFLMDATGQYLVSKVFDVTAETRKDDIESKQEIRVKVGQGIIGYSAETGEIVNIADAYEDNRFNREVDKSTGYKTKSILCVPIKNIKNEIIGVSQAVNTSKKEGCFTQKDEEIFSLYLSFCAIAIRNAQLFEYTVAACEHNEILLHLTRSIFSEVKMEVILKKIMRHAVTLVSCERCSIFMVDKDSNELYSTVFDLTDDEDGKEDEPDKEKKDKEKEIRFPIGRGIAGAVAQTGNSEIILDPYGDSRFNSDIDKETGFLTRNILCMPIRNKANDIVGVAQLVNKIGEAGFSKEDENLFKSFAIFCGIGMHNAKLYEEVFQSMMRQKIALSILSYHTVAKQEDVQRVLDNHIPSASELKIIDFGFSARSLDYDGTILAIFTMCREMGFMDRYHIPERRLAQFTLTVRNNYRDVLYHNWMHAFSVAHCMFVCIMKGQLVNYLPQRECLALFFACLCHDLDHRGTNNSYQVETANPIACLYSTSTMEHHHFDHSIFILNAEGNNIFANIPSSEYDVIIQVMEHAILATDLALYFKNRASFDKVTETGTYSQNNGDNRALLRGMLMTACDVSAITKPWIQQRRIAEIVYSEFFEQGDLEKETLGKQPPAMMDRSKQNELPKMQLGFIDFICLPVYKALAKFDRGLSGMHEGVVNNRQHWEKLSQKPIYLSVDEDPDFMDMVKATKILAGTIEGNVEEADAYVRANQKTMGRKITTASTKKLTHNMEPLGESGSLVDPRPKKSQEVGGERKITSGVARAHDRVLEDSVSSSNKQSSTCTIL